VHGSVLGQQFPPIPLPSGSCRAELGLAVEGTTGRSVTLCATSFCRVDNRAISVHTPLVPPLESMPYRPGGRLPDPGSTSLPLPTLAAATRGRQIVAPPTAASGLGHVPPGFPSPRERLAGSHTRRSRWIIACSGNLRPVEYPRITGVEGGTATKLWRWSLGLRRWRADRKASLRVERKVEGGAGLGQRAGT
jgi:hypothetical protein